MKVHILGSGDVPTEVLDLAPEHEQDFCDTCGDCLYCFAEDGCGGVDGEPHSWVVYPEDATGFRQRMGLLGFPEDGEN